MKDIPVWKVQKCDGAEYLMALLQFLLAEYSRVFGTDIMTAEECIVYNDPESECPRIIFNTVPIRIRLHQKSLSFWAQTIFQLSHEMCHYAMYQAKEDKEQTLSWFEEIVCEAMSLYALEMLQKTGINVPYIELIRTFAIIFRIIWIMN